MCTACSPCSLVRSSNMRTLTSEGPTQCGNALARGLRLVKVLDRFLKVTRPTYRRPRMLESHTFYLVQKKSVNTLCIIGEVEESEAAVILAAHRNCGLRLCCTNHIRHTFTSKLTGYCSSTTSSIKSQPFFPHRSVSSTQPDIISRLTKLPSSEPLSRSMHLKMGANS
jgi:hypothetical protein